MCRKGLYTIVGGEPFDVPINAVLQQLAERVKLREGYRHQASAKRPDT
jgi:hypothetical protein